VSDEYPQLDHGAELKMLHADLGFRNIFASRIRKPICMECTEYGCFTCTEFKLHGHCPSAHNSVPSKCGGDTETDYVAVPEVRRELEPAAVTVGLPSVSQGSQEDIRASREARYQMPLSKGLDNVYYHYEDNRRYILVKFKHFAVCYKFHWWSKHDEARSLGISVSKLKRQYKGRLNRDFKSLRMERVYTLDLQSDPESYNFTRCIRRLPKPLKAKEVSYFNLLIEGGAYCSLESLDRKSNRKWSKRRRVKPTERNIFEGLHESFMSTFNLFNDTETRRDADFLNNLF
jgi:hypothetical protein